MRRNNPHAEHEVKRVEDMSHLVLKKFVDQLDEVTLLQKRIAAMVEKDPFAAKSQQLETVGGPLKATEEHFRMLRLGQEMIENLFE